MPAILRTALEMGAAQIIINAVNGALLRDAMERPQQYPISPSASPVTACVLRLGNCQAPLPLTFAALRAIICSRLFTADPIGKSH
jgi:hypothetical protein